MGGVVPRPSLFGRLGSSARVTVVSAPAGSGKTVLLRSWIAEAGLAGRVAWVAAGRGEHDPQRFWLSVFGALRQTGPGTGLVRAVSPAPDLDGWALAEGLLSDLAALGERLWLVIDDVHEVDAEALRQLQLLIMRAPPELRFVLTARHDVRLGLHRLRVEGGLTEIRAGDLKFTVAEAGELFTAAGVELDEPTLAVLHERTEGWAAGLRLAALSLAGHPDPARFAAGFSGTDRTVAEYLLAEVLDRLTRRRSAAPGAGCRAGPPDRTALPGVHRPGVVGGRHGLPVIHAGSRARYGGGRAGRAARLDRRPGLRPRRYDPRNHAGLAGAGGGGGALAPESRAHPQSRSRPTRCGRSDALRPRGF
jgi:hypothetical protein